MTNPINLARRIWNAWRDVRNKEITTRVKHAVLVGTIAVVAFVGLVWQIQQINARDRADDQRTAAIETYNQAVRTYDTEVIQYNACLASIESREATRADNARDNALFATFVEIFDFYLGESADPAITDLRAAVVEGARLDEAERPEIDPSTCPPPPVPPEPPTL